MNKDFDKILSKKIKVTFENQNLPYNPEHWKMLLAKKNKKRKKVLFLWRVAAIFVFSLLAGGFVLFFNKTTNFENSSTPKIIFESKNDSLKKDSLKFKNEILITSSFKDTLDKVNQQQKSSDTVFNVQQKKILNQNNAINKFIKKNEITLNEQIFEKRSNKTFANEILQKDSLNTPVYLALNDSLNTNKNILAEAKKDSITTKKDFIATLDALNKPETDEIEKETNKHLKIGVDFAPIINYTSENENSTIGLVSGFSIDYPISNTIDISAGILYSNQKFDLNQPSNYLKDAVSLSNSSQLVDKSATLEGIEIPINIKYNFSIDNKAVFVSLGFSSTSSFNENIESKYKLNTSTQTRTKDASGNNIVKYELYYVDKTILTPNTSKAFNFANIINASLGINIPTKNNQSIIVEPYLKYYLAPISQQKVDVIGAGIHLRYIFSLQKNN